MRDLPGPRPAPGVGWTLGRWATGLLTAACLLLASPGVPADDEDTQPDPSAAGKPALVLDAGGHTAPIRAVLFTPDGKQVITAALDKTIRVWDAATGASVRVIRPPAGTGGEGRLLAAALSPDGRTLAVAGTGYLRKEKHVAPVYLIDPETGKLHDGGVLLGQTAAIHALAFSPDGKLLAAAGDPSDNTGRVSSPVRIWKIQKKAVEQVLEGHTDSVRALAWSPDGTRLASCGRDRQVVLWSLPAGKAEQRIACGAGKERNIPDAPGQCLAWSPDGKLLAAPGERPAAVRLLEASSGQFLRNVIHNRDFVAAGVVFTPDSQALMVAGVNAAGPVAQLHDVETGKGRGHLNVRMHGPVTAAALAPDGKRVALAGTPTHAVILWHAEDSKFRRRLGSRAVPIHAAGWIADGKTLAWRVTAANDKTAFPFERSFQVSELQLGQARVKEYQGARPRTEELTLVHPPRKAHVVHVQRDRKTVATLVLEEKNVPRAMTLVGNESVAVAGRDHGLFLFDAATGKQTQSFRGFQGKIHHLAPSPDGRYLLAAGTDPVLYVFRPDRPDPLLSLFVLGGEWVAWTPEGYYAASAGGEKLMGWQIDNGLEALGTFYPAEQFRKTLRRPDALARLLEEGSLEKALAAADRERKLEKTEVIAVAEVLPPEVTLTAPGLKDGNLTEPTVEVEAVARGKGKHPVASLQLLLDGRPYAGAGGLHKVEAAKPGETVKHAWKVELPEGGEHTLRVLARTAASMGISNDVEVVYDKPAPKAKLFLLAVGIDNYADKVLQLHCAVNDATELAATFVKKSSDVFEVQSPKVLTDGSATRDGILAGLQWLQKGMKPQDVAVIFYAGHGDKDGKDFFLLPQDVQKANLKQTGISGDELRKALAAIPGRVLLLLDACHSGAIGKVINDMARDLADEDCGVVVLCAALGSETAGEKERHGYFCLALLEALRGDNQAPRNPRDGRVYLHHLEQYVIDRVQELSNDEQHPTAAKPAIRSFALAKP